MMYMDLFILIDTDFDEVANPVGVHSSIISR